MDPGWFVQHQKEDSLCFFGFLSIENRSDFLTILYQDQVVEYTAHTSILNLANIYGVAN